MRIIAIAIARPANRAMDRKQFFEAAARLTNVGRLQLQPNEDAPV
jgi:hypothetical protein